MTTRSEQLYAGHGPWDYTWITLYTAPDATNVIVKSAYLLNSDTGAHAAYLQLNNPAGNKGYIINQTIQAGELLSISTWMVMVPGDEMMLQSYPGSYLIMSGTVLPLP